MSLNDLMNEADEQGLQVHLLGTPKISRNNMQLAMTSEHPLCLLAYLAVKKTWVSRHELSSLLYPEVLPSVGKTRLRQLIQRIKAHGVAPNLEVMPDQLRWLSGSDLHNFRGACQRQNWQLAFEHYHGLLLQSLEPLDTAFGDWLEQERRSLEREWCEVTLNYAKVLEARQEYVFVVEVLEKVLERDLFAEDILIVYLRNATFAGRHERALGMYTEFNQRLQDEVGMSLHPNTLEAFKLFRQQNIIKNQDVVTQEYDLTTSLLLGREKEFRLLQDLLTSKKFPIINVVGLGGMGKTRLVVEVIQTYFEKVVFVNCLVLHAEQSLEKHIASSLGVELDGKLTPSQGLSRVLEQQSLLLVLDNIEHILEAVRLVIQALAKLVNIRFLLTSRNRLGISQEFVLELDGLVCQDSSLPIGSDSSLPIGSDSSLPIGSDSSLAISSDSSLATSPAAQVFIHLLQMQSNMIELNHQEQKTVEAIVQCLAGVPLAIELAVAWTRLRPLSEILLELQHSLDFLADGLSGITERHNGMRAIFEQTWNLLEPPLQVVLQRLSVFVGSIDRDFALQVTKGHNRDLLRLLDCGVLKRSMGQVNRFELHPIIGDYVKEKLQQQTIDEKATYERLLSLAVQITSEHGSMAKIRSVQILQQEYPTICTAKTWALKNQAIEDALKIGIELQWYWITFNIVQEGVDWLKKLIKAAHYYTNNHVYVGCLVSLVALLRAINQYDEAIRWNKKALKIANLNQYTWMQGRIYMNFGLFALLNLDYKRAEKYHRKSIKIMEILPKETRIIGAKINLARILICQDKNITAERILKNVLRFAKKIDDPVSMIVVCITLSIIELKKEKIKQAKNYIKKALKISKSIQRFTENGTCYYYLALIYLKNNEFADAHVCFEKSFQVNFSRKHDFMTVSSLKNLAQIHIFQLNFETALHYWLLAKLFEKNASGINDATYYHPLIDTQFLWQKLGAYRYRQICQAIRALEFPTHIIQLLKELSPVTQ